MVDDGNDIARGAGHSARVAMYEVADNELAVGSTLGGPRVAIVIKATGAIQKVWSVDLGASVFGTIVLRHYDERTGAYLPAAQPGVFRFHPEHQEHSYMLMNGISVYEDIFVLSGAPEDGEAVDPPAVYYTVRLTNENVETVRLATYAFADLRGDTGHDVQARYRESAGALFAWNRSNPDWVRVFGCSPKPTSYETTVDSAKSVAQRSPGPLANQTVEMGDPIGALHISSVLKPGASRLLTFRVTFSGNGREAAIRTYRTCPPPVEGLQRTMDYYHNVMRQAVVLTPDQQINRGVLWAKANMLRVITKAPQGWCFTNDPTRSNNSVGRDTAWFAFGADYIAPWFSRASLEAYLSRQQPSGKIVEYYDVRTGKAEDYGLNINDDTPLVVLALWHHYSVTRDLEFLKRTYKAASKAADYILSQRNDQGLVWCTSTGTSSWGMVSWRNIIPNYRLSGAVTELNAECYAAIRTVSRMARLLEHHDDSARYEREADALKDAINTHLYNPENKLYYLCIDIDGRPRSDVTCDLVFPVMFGVATEETAAHIVGRLSSADFWTSSGMRTLPRDSVDYSPDYAAGLQGGVWVGVSFWYAFAAAQFTPEFMDRALSISFRNYSSNPRGKNTVPGQFSEWLHGETLVNQGMMLSPWFPPRYIWAAIEGITGLNGDNEVLSIEPRLEPDWKWLAVQNLPYRGLSITFFAVRLPEVSVYTNTSLQRAERARTYDEDITAAVHSDGDTITTVGLRHGADIVVLAGSTDAQAVSTSLRIEADLEGTYAVRIFNSLLGRWADDAHFTAQRLRDGITLQIERKGFCLLDISQET